MYIIGTPKEFTDFLVKDTGYTAPVEELELEGSSGMCINICPDNANQPASSYVIWQRKYELGCLVHELTHLTMMIFEHKSVAIHWENTEAFAYYTEFWFNEITRTKRRLPQGRLPAEVMKV